MIMRGRIGNRQVANRDSEPAARSNDQGVVMSDASASQMHVSLKGKDDAAVGHNRWTEPDAPESVAEPKLDSSTPAATQPPCTQSKSSISHRRTAPSENAVRIAIQSKGRVVLFDASKLLAIEAQGNYVLLQQQTCSHLFRKSISKVEESLGPYGFVRIHRSVVVNSAHVEEIQPSPTGECRVRMRSGKTYNVGRRYTSNLRLLAEAWIDAES